MRKNPVNLNQKNGSFEEDEWTDFFDDGPFTLWTDLNDRQ